MGLLENPLRIYQKTSRRPTTIVYFYDPVGSTWVEVQTIISSLASKTPLDCEYKRRHNRQLVALPFQQLGIYFYGPTHNVIHP